MNLKNINWLDGTRNFLIIALIALLINLPALYFLKQGQTKIAVIDVQALLTEYEKKVTAELYANQGGYQSAEGMQANSGFVEQKTKQFLQKLEGTIEQINQDCNCVIVNKAALLTQSGKVTDYTDEVRKALEK